MEGVPEGAGECVDTPAYGTSFVGGKSTAVP